MNRTEMTTPRRRWIELARAAWGAALLVVPRAVLGRVHHLTIDDRSLLVARILGARHLTQAALSGVGPSSDVLALGVWVDCAHATTAVALSAVDRSRARGALTDAGIAAVWAVAGYRDVRSGAVPPPPHDRRRDVLARLALRFLPGGAALLRLSKDRRRDAQGGAR